MSTEIIKELSLADKIAPIAVKQIRAAETFKQPRMKEIRESEDILAYVLKPALQGRYNVPFDGVIANGFLDTFTSQVNKPPRLEFSDPKGSNFRSVRKIQAQWESDSSSAKGKWGQKDRFSKRICGYSNIGIFKYYAESDPKYRSHLEVVDHYDFLCEPNGGGQLEDHLFCGQTNIFKDISSLKNKIYDQGQVKKLIDAHSQPDYKFNEDIYRNKISRFAALGLDIESNNYVGQQLFNLTEWVTEYQGVRYYIVLDYKTGIWVRFAKLSEIFESDLFPWVVWKGTENAFNIWDRGPFDQIKPIVEAIRINLNEVLTNNRKRNWDMKAVDKKMFPDISKLDWRQDGVVHAEVGLNQDIRNGVYHFTTPEISGALNLNAYLNNLTGINSGISDQTKGQSTQDVLGIAKIDELQLSKRMKLVGDSYSEGYADIGLRYDWGLYEHLPEKYAIKVLGANGVEMENILKEDTEPDYDIRVIVATDDLVKNELTAKQKSASLERIARNPSVLAQLNPKWYLEQELLVGGWKEEDVKRALDRRNDATDDIISDANKALEKMVEGKKPKRARNATTGFLQVIHNYLMDNELKADIRANIQKYFDEHVPIAIENSRRAQMMATDYNAPVEEKPVTTVPATPTAPVPTPNVPVI